MARDLPWVRRQLVRCLIVFDDPGGTRRARRAAVPTKGSPSAGEVTPQRRRPQRPPTPLAIGCRTNRRIPAARSRCAVRGGRWPRMSSRQEDAARQSDHFRAGDFRRVRSHHEGAADIAYATHVGLECDQRHHDCGRTDRGRSWTGIWLLPGVRCRDPGRRQCRRWLPGDPPHACDVQEALTYVERHLAVDTHSLVKVVYLVSAVLFIFGLKQMAHPRTAVRGNLLGAIGMLLAIVMALVEVAHRDRIRVTSTSYWASSSAWYRRCIGLSHPDDCHAPDGRPVQRIRRPGLGVCGRR